jgi:anti-anti-sigma regulatory factor
VSIAEGVLFVPIVGHLDSSRADAITARLLEEAHRQRAAMVVLDIAGVPVVDTAVAQGLQRATSALRLLGCDVAVSGIGARVAATLVQLGATLDGVISVRTPQDALDRFAGQRRSPQLPA